MKSVSLQEILDNRELRAARQKQLLQQGGALVYFTLNIPGPVKISPRIRLAFCEGKARISQTLDGICTVHLHDERCAPTGYEAWWLVEGNSFSLKRAMCNVEDMPLLGRLWDIDVLTPDGKISRQELSVSGRKCLICDQNAFICARSRAHTVNDMLQEIHRRVDTWQADVIADCAVRALITEANTTPKPGLVDKRNCGSHPDMSLDLLGRSAHSLRAYFRECALLGASSADIPLLFPQLQRAGIQAEKSMLTITNGVNTHRGALFSLGLLCASCAHLCTADSAQICALAGDICRPAMQAHFAALSPDTACSHGETLYIAHGVRGIRGEAAAGFPAVVRTAFPALQTYLRRYSLQEAGARTLIHLLACTEDTTLIRRGGVHRAREIAVLAAQMCKHKITDEQLIALDDLFIRENLTCGGCADLLSCAYFLHILKEEPAWKPGNC